MRCVSCLLLCVCVVALPGCERKPAQPAPNDVPADTVTSDDVRRDASQALETTAQYSQQAKEDLEARLAARLAELDREMTELRAKGRELQGQAKENWDAKMAELEVKREVARDRLAEISESSAAAWDDVRRGASAAWTELEKSFQEAKEEF